jgi:hypothetical protein
MGADILKKVVSFKTSFMISVMALVFCGFAFCQEEGAPPARKAPATPAKAKAQVVEKAKAQPASPIVKQPTAEEMEKRKNMIKAAKEKLNNLVWHIEVAQMTSEPQKETYKDTLRFTDNKVASEHLASDDFPSTNYTVSMSGENVVVWETMQTSEKKGLAFWKGEVEGGVMRGVLSRHFDEKSVRDYSFSSVGPSEAMTPSEKKEEPKPAEVTEKKAEPKKEVEQKQADTAKKKSEDKTKKKKGVI